jgi:DNA-binding Xre family transcriptional regulator
MPETDNRRVFRSRLALREMPLRAGLIEQALTARLGVTHHTVETWETEKGRPVRQKWPSKLAEALGCSAAELRPAESVARSKRQRRAWVKRPNAPSSPTPRTRFASWAHKGRQGGR